MVRCGTNRDFLAGGTGPVLRNTRAVAKATERLTAGRGLAGRSCVMGRAWRRETGWRQRRTSITATPVSAGSAGSAPAVNTMSPAASCPRIFRRQVAT
jgi:hypothetical protein